MLVLLSDGTSVGTLLVLQFCILYVFPLKVTQLQFHFHVRQKITQQMPQVRATYFVRFWLWHKINERSHKKYLWNFLKGVWLHFIPCDDYASPDTQLISSSAAFWNISYRPISLLRNISFTTPVVDHHHYFTKPPRPVQLKAGCCTRPHVVAHCFHALLPAAHPQRSAWRCEPHRTALLHRF